jgi:hypothetical protein
MACVDQEETHMAENGSFVQEGLDRVSDAYRSLDERVQRFQRELRARRKLWEKQLGSGRKSLEKQVLSGRRRLERRTRKQWAEIKRSELVKRAQSLQRDARGQLESTLSGVLGWFQIASKNDLDRLDRKLGQIHRKLRELEGTRRPRRSNGSAATA